MSPLALLRPRTDSPPNPSLRRQRLLALLGYGSGAVIAIVAMIAVLNLPAANLKIPLEYSGDAILHNAVVRAVIENFWYWNNPRLGMPTGLELHDCPFVLGDGFHLLATKFLGLFGGGPALAFNLYYLLGYPAATLTMMVLLRRLGVSFPPAIVAGVLFAFLPFHMQRGEIHIFIATYYAIPLLVLVALWLGEREALFQRATRRRTITCVLLCLLVSATGLHQAFFACVLLLVAGACAAVRGRSWRHGVAALALVGVIGFGLGLASLPVMSYHRVKGRNPTVMVRPFTDSEVLGLKISHLVFPRNNHRLPTLAKLNRIYVKLPMENSTAALGVVGSVGFLGLLGWVLVRRRGERPGVVDRLAELNLGAVLFATVGGFSAVFAILVSPQIRGHNRMSPFIGCLALAAVALALERFHQRWRRVFYGAGAALIVLGLLDQSSDKDNRKASTIATQWQSDREFTRRVEAALPAGAMLFQLPYVPFPERGYDGLRPYLHSKTLRWSFPAMHGRETAAWLQQTADSPTAQLLERAALAGFDGIFIDREGYTRGGPVEKELTTLLGAGPWVSHNGRHSFFDIRNHRQALRGHLSPADWHSKVQAVVHPLHVAFGRGFLGAEKVNNVVAHGCEGDCLLELDNRASRARTAVLKLRLVPFNPSTIELSGDLLNESVAVRVDALLTRKLTVPPGKHVLRLRSDGKPAAGVAKKVVFRVDDLSLLYDLPE